MRKTVLWMAALLLANICLAQHRVRLDTLLTEISGLACTPDGRLWALNDGGHAPDLFNIDRKTGQIIEKRRLPVPNRDWEDLAADPEGNLYVADVGNNNNRRRDLRIYKYHPQNRTLDSMLFRYPEQQSFPPGNKREWYYDCEAVVWWNDSLHLFTKSRFLSDHRLYHYIIPASPGFYNARLVDSIVLKNRVVSGGGISRDGRTLALTSYIVGKKWGFWPYTKASVYWFESTVEGRWLNGKHRRGRLPKLLIARQFESVVQLSDGAWIAANEGIWVQKPALWRIRRK